MGEAESLKEFAVMGLRMWNDAKSRLAGWCVAALLLSLGGSAAVAQQSPTLPFTLELQEPFTIEGMPPLQSYVHAHADVDGLKWLMVAGRHSGLHEFVEPTAENPANDFAIAGDNDHLWVVDPVQRKVWSTPLGNLPHVATDPLRASNCLSCQDGNLLYVVGGYGQTEGANTTGDMLTFDTLTVLDVANVIQAVMQGKSIAPYVQQTSDPGLRVTGGGLLPLDGQLYMVFGQIFDGLYSPLVKDSTSVFFQHYTQQVRRVTVRRQPKLTVKVESFPNFSLGQPRPDDPDAPFHRRDLTVAPAISPEGKPRIGAYGGVFRPGQYDGYVQPIYIDAIGTKSFDYQGQSYNYDTILPGVDARAAQLLSQYDCAFLALHDDRSGEMFTTFFGGISTYRYDDQADQLVKDQVVLAPDGTPLVDGMPFVKTVSLLRVDKRGETSNLVLPVEMPGYLGAEAALLVDPRVPRHPNGVIRVDQIEQPTVVGYIFGGIESTAPYTTAPNKAAPNKAAPNKAAPNKAAPNKAAPNKAAPNKGEPGEARTQASNRFIPVLLRPTPWAVKRMPPAPKR